MQDITENAVLYVLVGLAFSMVSLDIFPYFRNKRKIEKAISFIVLWMLWPIFSFILTLELLKVLDD